MALIDVERTANLLGTTERHVRELIANKRIPYVKVGRLVRFDTDDLAEWIDSRRVPVRETA